MVTSHSRYGRHAKKRTSWISVGAQVAVMVLGGITLFVIIYHSDEIASLARAQPAYNGAAASEWVMALRSPNPMLRRDAVDALGQIDVADRSTIDALTIALQDEDPIVRVSAEAALRKMSKRYDEPVSFTDDQRVHSENLLSARSTY